jgi:hypothetical protein
MVQLRMKTPSVVVPIKKLCVHVAHIVKRGGVEFPDQSYRFNKKEKGPEQCFEVETEMTSKCATPAQT